MYVCTYVYSYQLHYMFYYIGSMYVDREAFFRPEAGYAFLLVAALHCFRLESGTFSTGSTIYRGKRVSCLGTVILSITH